MQDFTRWAAVWSEVHEGFQKGTPVKPLVSLVVPSKTSHPSIERGWDQEFRNQTSSPCSLGVQVLWSCDPQPDFLVLENDTWDSKSYIKQKTQVANRSSNYKIPKKTLEEVAVKIISMPETSMYKHNLFGYLQWSFFQANFKKSSLLSAPNQEERETIRNTGRTCTFRSSTVPRPLPFWLV